jgi:predicted metal-binding protein
MEGAAPLPDPHRPRRRVATVLVCRGCCCGTERKHPEVDHEAQLRDLRAAAAASGAVVRQVGCLGPCSESNVMVVRSPGATKRHWFGSMLESDATAAMAGWIAAGCRGPVPAELAPNLLGPTTSSVPAR